MHATSGTTTVPQLDPLVEGAVAALDRAGADWCVLRGADALDRPGHDVDLLLSRRSLRCTRAALAAAGFAPLPLNSQHHMLAAYRADDDRWLALDIVTELVYGRPPCVLRVPLASRCLDRRRRVAGVPVLEPADAFWTELLHALLDREDVRPDIEVRLGALARTADVGTSPIAQFLDARAGGVSERLRELAAAGDWPAARELVPVPRERAWIAAAAGRGLRRTRRKLGRRGVSVAVVGPDGAGKSTLAAALETGFPLATRRFYMGLQDGASVPGHTWTASAPARSPGRRRPLPLRLVRQWRRLLRLSRRSLFASLQRARGRLVVFDRYPYDADVHWTNATRIGGGVRRRLLRCAAPRPDVVVVLDVPGAVTFERKGEHSPELLESRRQRYLALAPTIRGAEVVDGTLPADDVRRVVTALVWQAYVARSSTGAGGLGGVRGARPNATASEATRPRR